MKNAQTIIEAAWEDRANVTLKTKGNIRKAVDFALEQLDSGKARVAEKQGGEWHVNQWLKKAVLLSFRLNDMELIKNGPGNSKWWDKVPSKFDGWTAKKFRDAGFRAVPNCVVRKSAYIAPGAILMPSFVNLGAYVDTGTMVDTWVTVGSCAQIGKNVHLSGGVGIGGVLEPMQAALRSLKTIASSARARKSSKVSSSAKARSSPWASSSVSPPRSSTAPQAKSTWARCRHTRWLCQARFHRSHLLMVRLHQVSIAR